MPHIHIMGRVIEFLNGLDEYELAFFAKFKRNTYMPKTQEMISNYLLEKGFTKSKIDRLIESNPDDKLKDEKKRCTRCYSDKIRKNKIEWNTMNKGIEGRAARWDAVGGKVTFKDEVVCNVCEFWIEDPNQEKPSGMWNKIANGILEFVGGVFRN